ncbi:hypothetical protein FGO68_gene10930 [Halteria grandinella]|uniref:Uncharacterized protein n=1 Tax=Halteria grandinella TaxID=5974 RepID=A0A8J8NAK8_HALGN|nr:hypothetical protein FGO68_gene10930 [Halteria grandinella]
MKGQNATYLKQQIKHSMDELTMELQTLRDPVKKEEIQLMLDKLQKRLNMVERILHEKHEKDQIYVKASDEQGTSYNLAAQELESKLAAEEWRKDQEFYRKHPELKKNNFFMKSVGAGLLQKLDSYSEALPPSARVFENEQEREKYALHCEIKEIEKRQKEFEDIARLETAYQRIQRMKREQEDFHKHSYEQFSINSVDELQKHVQEWQLQKKENGGSYQAKRQLIKAHPDFEQSQLKASLSTLAQSDPNAKIITFEEYFGQI